MTAIIAAVLTLTVLGLFFGLLLAVSSKIFKVDQDERIPEVQDCLPGANCGGCGYAGCANLAEAIVSGTAPVNSCPVGGAAVAAKIAEIMGVDAGDTVRKTAYVRCTGGSAAHKKFQYEGLQDCAGAIKVGGGPLDCNFGCIGLGTCVKTCPYDAISIKDGVAVVDSDKCKACSKCIAVCPRQLITLIPVTQKVTVGCASKQKGAEVRKNCDAGCIGCSLCVRNCPHGAIEIVDNLAKIDPDKCQNCGKCAEVCMRKIIKVK